MTTLTLLSVALFIYVTAMLKLDGTAAGSKKLFTMIAMTTIVTVVVSSILIS